MADGVTTKINGLAQLAKTLEQDLPESMSKGVIREALHAGGAVIATEAEASAPRRSGELAEDIVVAVRVGTSRYGLNGVAFVGPAFDRSNLRTRKRGKYAGQQDPSTSPGVYGKFVETGHAPPGMAAEKRKAKRKGIEIEFGGHDTPPQPWLGPAFNSSQSEALDAIVSTLRDGIAEAARKVAKK